MAKASRTATARKISTVGDFKQRLGGIVELPSGFTVKVKNPGGLQAFMEAGVIPNSLMTLLDGALNKGKKVTENDILNEEGTIDPTMLADMMRLLNAVAVKVIVEPRIYPVPTEEEVEFWNMNNPENPASDIEDLREDDKLYADELPQDDKMFLFQWITGGTRDLERFRKEYAASMESMAAVSGPGESTE